MSSQRKCFKCPAMVLMGVTESGAAMPINPDPDPAGNVVFTGEQRRDNSGRLRDAVVVLGKKSSPFDPRVHFMPHWATCSGVTRKARKVKPPKEPKPTKERPAPQMGLEL